MWLSTLAEAIRLARAPEMIARSVSYRRGRSPRADRAPLIQLITSDSVAVPDGAAVAAGATRAIARVAIRAAGMATASRRRAGV